MKIEVESKDDGFYITFPHNVVVYVVRGEDRRVSFNEYGVECRIWNDKLYGYHFKVSISGNVECIDKDGKRTSYYVPNEYFRGIWEIIGNIVANGWL